MSVAPSYRPAEDRLIIDACSRSRAERIRDLARELGRSETAIRRRWQRLVREGLVPASVASTDPWNAIIDAAGAGCSLCLGPGDVARLAADDAIQRAALNLSLEDDAW